MLPALIIVLVYSLLTIPTALLGVPWTLITGDISFLYRTSMRVMRLGTQAAGIRIAFESHARLDPATQYIFLSNHVSNLDPPILLPLLPGRSSVFLKRSLMKLPIIGYGMRLASFIPVDRDGRVESARESVAFASQVLASGVNVMAFVEGTRSRDGRLLPFKKGPFYLAMESGTPVIPVSIWGTESMMKKGSLRLYPGVAHVTFHSPLFPRAYGSREELMAATRLAIESGLPSKD